MKFTTSAEEFRRVVGAVAGAAAQKSTQEALKCILVTATGGIVMLRANDLEIGAEQSTMNPIIGEDGIVCLPARELAALAKDIGDDEVTVRQLKQSVEIKSGALTVRLVGPDPSSFPFSNQPKSIGKVTVKGADLVTALRETIYATAKEETRYAINGVLLEASKDLVVVATDGRRLAMRAASIVREPANDLSAIIPLRAAQLVSKWASEDEDVEIAVAKDSITFSQEDSKIFSRLLDARFPAYQQVIPKATTGKVRVERARLVAGIRQAAVVLSGKDLRTVHLEFTADGEMRIEAEQSATGTAVASVPCESNVALRVAVNADYLIDPLRASGADVVEFNVTDGSAPMLIEIGKLQYILMPITAS